MMYYWSQLGNTNTNHRPNFRRLTKNPWLQDDVMRSAKMQLVSGFFGPQNTSLSSRSINNITKVGGA